MKKMLIFIVLLMTILSACTENDEISNNLSGEINVLFLDSLPQNEYDILDTAIKAIEQRNPGTKINVEKVSLNQYERRVSEAHKNYNAPDLFMTWVWNWAEYESNG